MANLQEMTLTDRVFRSFRVAKVFRENTDVINCLDFSHNGENMIASSNDDSIVVYCCMEGRPKRTVYSKKYGCDLLQYTHAPNAIIYSSNKVDDTIRYLSLHDNKYLRYFPGHTKRVVALKMSPVNDMFLSGSLDRTIRLWDLRSPNCQGLMHLSGGRPIASFDPEGLIFAAGIESKQLKLYDLRSFDKGPFSTFHVCPDFVGYEWTGIKFSSDGKLILISTNISQIKIMDAYTGSILQTLSICEHYIAHGLTSDYPDWSIAATSSVKIGYEYGRHVTGVDANFDLDLHEEQTLSAPDLPEEGTMGVSMSDEGHLNSSGLTLEASFTPDSKYVISGSQDGTVHVWSVKTGEEIVTLDGGHPTPTHCVQCNPKYLTLASAGRSLAFWLPATEEWIPSHELAK